MASFRRGAGVSKLLLGVAVGIGALAGSRWRSGWPPGKRRRSSAVLDDDTVERRSHRIFIYEGMWFSRWSFAARLRVSAPPLVSTEDGPIRPRCRGDLAREPG